MIQRLSSVLILVGFAVTIVFAFQNCAQDVPNSVQQSSNGALTEPENENEDTTDKEIEDETETKSCSAEEVLFDGTCFEKERACEPENGSVGIENYKADGEYGACVAKVCDAGFHVEANVCKSNKRTCTVAGGGSGTQTWDAAKRAYGTCVLSKCPADEHLEAGVCKPDVRDCNIANGKGTQTWNDSSDSWGTCRAKTCNTGYALIANACSSLVTVWRTGKDAIIRDQKIKPDSGGVAVFKIFANELSSGYPLSVCGRRQISRDPNNGQLDPINLFITRRSKTCAEGEKLITALGYIAKSAGQLGAKRALYRCVESRSVVISCGGNYIEGQCRSPRSIPLQIPHFRIDKVCGTPVGYVFAP